MNQANAKKNWYIRARTAAAEEIPVNERIFGALIVAINFALVMFFSLHEIQDTGFFTTTFRLTEMILLYGSLGCWMITAVLESFLGLRLASRLFDVFFGIPFIAVAWIWQSVTFPFDFAYFADVLPASLQVLAGWITEGIARVVMVIFGIAMGAMIVYSPVAYGFVDKKPKKVQSGEA